MARYMVIGKLSPEGCAGLLEQGFQARLEQFTAMVEERDGTVEGYWVNDQGESVVMFSHDTPWDRATAAIATMASGAWNDVRTMELFDAPELDRQRADMLQYTPPGS